MRRNKWILRIIIFVLPILGFGGGLKKVGTVSTEQGFMWSKKLGTIPILYEVRALSILDQPEKTYFTITYNKGVDYILYLNKANVQRLLKYIIIYKQEREALIEEKNYQDFYLGHEEYSFLEESIYGSGRSFGPKPTVNYGIAYRGGTFYLELDPLSSIVNKRELDPDKIFFTDSDLRVLVNFIYRNYVMELVGSSKK